MMFNGGARIGRSYLHAMNETIPFSTLEVESDEVQLKTFFFGTYTFTKDELTRVSTYRGLFGKGLRFEHERNDYPPLVVFWPRDISAVKGCLVRNKYVLVETKPVNTLPS